MPHKIVLCRYDYDPQDRLAARTPSGEAATFSFYRGDRLASEIGSVGQRRFLHREHQLLALQTPNDTTLSATDRSGSVLGSARSGQHTTFAYTPYGHREPNGHLPGFNGEQPDPVTGHYLLGKGYRAYNPVLMRFNSPDSLSPFGEGGVNPYVYCRGDPVNQTDPTGHISWQFIVGLTLSVAALTASTATLWPSLPFILSVKAAQAGFLSTGSLFTIVTGVSAVAGGALGISRQIVAEVAPDSPLLEPFGWAALALGVSAASSRVGTVIAARNPKNLMNIQQAVAQRGMPKLLGSSPDDLNRAVQATRDSSASSASIRLFPL